MKPAVFLAIAYELIGTSDGALAAPAPPQLPELVAPLQISDPTSYEIEMQTSLVIPADGPQATELRVWQALPTQKPWSSNGNKHRTAAQGIEFSPATGKQEQLVEQQSNHVVWRLKEGLEPGTSLRFTTRYTVHSVTRKFNPSTAKSQWSKGFSPPKDINPTLAKLADKIRATMSPAQAVQQFCLSIKSSITYDASVPYKPLNVDATVANHRGQCGHIYQVFAQLCRRVGIPVRPVRGLNLRNPDGQSELSNIRADWTNIHTWSEVYLDGVGWVEVEPSGGTQAFSIPARYIQNNRWFQNYFLKLNIGGKWDGVSFTPDEGVFVSPYQVANLITFKVTKE